MTIYSKLILIACLLLMCVLPSFAEKIPVKIAPMKIITTHHDEIEVGDWIPFETVKNVYVSNKLYLKKGTKLIGIVGFVHPNGWGGDAAVVNFKTFYTTDVDDKKITINYPLEINGNSEIANSVRDSVDYSVSAELSRISSYFAWTAYILRGAEIFVEPDTKIYNIFIEQ